MNLAALHTRRCAGIAKVLANRMLEYYRSSPCCSDTTVYGASATQESHAHVPTEQPIMIRSAAMNGKNRLLLFVHKGNVYETSTQTSRDERNTPSRSSLCVEAPWHEDKEHARRHSNGNHTPEAGHSLLLSKKGTLSKMLLKG